MIHKGLNEFTGQEISSVSLGQLGFKIISNQTVTCGTTAGFEDIQYFIALKVVEDDADVEARSITEGDDLTTNSGVYNGSSPVTLINGDAVYGAFDKVKVASGDYVLAYIGRQHVNQ